MYIGTRTYDESITESLPDDGDDKVDLLGPQQGQVGMRVVLYDPVCKLL